MVPRRSASTRRLARMLAAAALSCAGLCFVAPHPALQPLAAFATKPPKVSPTPLPTATPTPIPTATPEPAESAAPKPAPTATPRPQPSLERHTTPAAVVAPPAPTPAAPPAATAPQASTPPTSRPTPSMLTQATSVPTTLASFARDPQGSLSPYVLGADVLAALAVASSLLLASLRRRGLV